MVHPSHKAGTKAKQRRQCFFAQTFAKNSQPPNFNVGGSDSRNAEAKETVWDAVVLLSGYSQYTLGDLPHSPVLRPQTADSGLEPEDHLEILVLQLACAL